MTDRVSRYRKLIGALIAIVVFFTFSYWVIHEIERVKSGGPRIQCMNNLKHLSVAVQQYIDANGKFPPGVIAVDKVEPQDCLAWTVSILPFLEKSDIFRQFQLEQSASNAANQRVGNSEWVRSLRCNATDGVIDPHFSTYAGITGLGADSAILDRGHERAGVFGHKRILQDTDFVHGKAKTIIAMEIRTELGPWFIGNRSTLRPIDPATAPYVRKDGPFGLGHPNCVMATFADGHIQPLRTDISPEIIEIMATIANPKLAEIPE